MGPCMPQASATPPSECFVTGRPHGRGRTMHAATTLSARQRWLPTPCTPRGRIRDQAWPVPVSGQVRTRQVFYKEFMRTMTRRKNLRRGTPRAVDPSTVEDNNDMAGSVPRRVSPKRGLTSRWAPLRSIAASTLMVLLAACGSGSDGPDGAASSKGPATTAPGTTLKVGQSATIEYSVGASGTAVITVAAFAQGNISELKNFKLDAAERSMTPWYIKYTVRNDGPSDPRGLGIDISTGVTAVDSDGESLRESLLLGSFPPCEKTLSSGTFPAGTTKQTCDVVLVAAGKTVKEARYSQVTGPYAQAPITWTP